jgi:hypothetical protein
MIQFIDSFDLIKGIFLFSLYDTYKHSFPFSSLFRRVFFMTFFSLCIRNSHFIFLKAWNSENSICFNLSILSYCIWYIKFMSKILYQNQYWRFNESLILIISFGCTWFYKQGFFQVFIRFFPTFYLLFASLHSWRERKKKR